jgi:hypothetical protein
MKPIKTLSASVNVNTLSAVVRYIRNERGRKVGVATEIEVRMGGCLLGKATLGGRYSQDQALAEFRKAPARFGWKQAVPSPCSDVFIGLGPVAVARLLDLPGVATPVSALALFQASPERFERCEGFEIALRLGLVRAAA